MKSTNQIKRRIKKLKTERDQLRKDANSEEKEIHISEVVEKVTRLEELQWVLGEG